jgi:hypothetical protein
LTPKTSRDALDEELDLLQAFHPGPDGEDVSFVFDEIYGPGVSLWQRGQPRQAIKIYRVQPAHDCALNRWLRERV